MQFSVDFHHVWENHLNPLHSVSAMTSPLPCFLAWLLLLLMSGLLMRRFGLSVPPVPSPRWWLCSCVRLSPFCVLTPWSGSVQPVCLRHFVALNVLAQRCFTGCAVTACRLRADFPVLCCKAQFVVPVPVSLFLLASVALFAPHGILFLPQKNKISEDFHVCG